MADLGEYSLLKGFAVAITRGGETHANKCCCHITCEAWRIIFAYALHAHKHREKYLFITISHFFLFETQAMISTVDMRNGVMKLLFFVSTVVLAILQIRPQGREVGLPAARPVQYVQERNLEQHQATKWQKKALMVASIGRYLVREAIWNLGPAAATTKCLRCSPSYVI